MVRVGGGWDTLENYLNKHDPCRCPSDIYGKSNILIFIQGKKRTRVTFTLIEPNKKTRL